MTDEELAAMQISAQIFEQLRESERFQRFVQVNYDIHKIVNEDEKTIEYRVIELPPVLAEARLTELVKDHAKENTSDIVSADLTDLKQIESILDKEKG